jgi:hypothetical protein
LGFDYIYYKTSKNFLQGGFIYRSNLPNDNEAAPSSFASCSAIKNLHSFMAMAPDKMFVAFIHKSGISRNDKAISIGPGRKPPDQVLGFTNRFFTGGKHFIFAVSLRLSI